MEGTVRPTRSGKPIMNIPLPSTFDATAEVEEGFLTPPIWVAMNPPSMFERNEMKRTVSEASSWGGDEDEESTVSSSGQTEKENEAKDELVITDPVSNM